MDRLDIDPSDVETGDLTHRPDRCGEIAAWLKTRRDEYPTGSVGWYIVDSLLDHYRLCADTGQPLGHVFGRLGDNPR